jgi:hypothetical protein
MIEPNGQLHQPPDPHFLSVAQLLQAHLVERAEHPLLVNLGSLGRGRPLAYVAPTSSGAVAKNSSAGI